MSCLQPLLSGCCPEDHVYPDRGRHKPGWCASTSLFDPITATSRPIGSPGRVDLRPSRWEGNTQCSLEARLCKQPRHAGQIDAMLPAAPGPYCTKFWHLLHPRLSQLSTVLTSMTLVTTVLSGQALLLEVVRHCPALLFDTVLCEKLHTCACGCPAEL